MRENLDNQIWKGRVWKVGLMEGDMRVTLRMERRMVREFLCGPRGSNILEVGGLGSSMG